MNGGQPSPRRRIRAALAAARGRLRALPLATAGLRLPTVTLPPWLPRRIPGGLRPWITLVSLGFVLAALLSQGPQMLRYQPDLQGWLWLLLALGVSLLSLAVNGLAWAVILRWLAIAAPWAAVVAHYLASNLRKYLPGGIWHIATRVQALRVGGVLGPPVATGRALAAALLDPLLAAVAALALVPLGGWQNGLALLCLLPLALLLPRWLRPLLSRLERRRAADLHLESDLATTPEPVVRGYPWAPLLAELAFVLVRFAGFACCVWAFDLPSAADWSVWLAGFALAWTAGLVVPGAPGGLGVFEAVLLLRLGVVVPEAPLLAVALSYRVVATAADLLAAALVGLDQRLARRWREIATTGTPSQ